MFGVKRYGFALLLSKDSSHEVKQFNYKSKAFKYRNKTYVITKKEMFFLRGKNPYISPIKNFRNFLFGNIRNYFLIYDLEKYKDKKFVQPLSFVKEIGEEYNIISPYLLVSIANQKGYTSWIKSLIKQAQTFPKWLKFVLIGLIVTVVFILFIMINGGM